jgi:trehalose 6-phosphate synthase/phosphatase
LLLRTRCPQATIGLLLHTPFPPSELFGILPHREELLKGLLGADLIGFHTASYRGHFASAVERYLGKPMAEGALDFRGRSVRTGVFPIGVDAEDHASRAAQLATKERVKAIRGDGSLCLLVGIDRLDHTKGIPRRLLSFQELLARRPEWRGKMRLIQIAVPSRGEVGAYQKLRHEVENLVGQINGTFGTTEWSPVQYLCRGVDRDEVTALYGAADVMLVTPVRDGMNLVAKEFVASRIDGDGVLVLSEFAGAAVELQDALVVNPYDIPACADAYHRAMTMPRPERHARMQALRESVTRYDVSRWTEHFLGELSPAAAPPRPRRSKRVLAGALLTNGLRRAWSPIAERLRPFGAVKSAARGDRPATVPQRTMITPYQ